MKRFLFTAIAAAVVLSTVCAERLVILHTNDTHSAIDPDRKTGIGGVLRRKAIVDSVRADVPQMMLIDAGDAVQGSLFFTLFGGEVERKLINAQGYDIAILGNHEFDNGLERLAENYRLMEPELLSSNYDFDGTPLEGLFLPYSIRQFGGKRIGFIAINLNPSGIIDESNTVGMKYRDGVKTANQLARLLKTKEGVDMVIAVTHIGYDSSTPDEPLTDSRLAAASRDIDVIIGGHSHTVVTPDTPMSLIPNLNGDTVLVAQTGKNGNFVGEIDIDLETLKPSYRLISVDSRLDDRIDPALAREIDVYRQKVDSIAAIKIGKSKREMPQDGNALLNLASDIVLEVSRTLSPVPVDFSIMNKGGVRASLPKGDITRGDIMTIFPFDNRTVVVEMLGSDVRRLIDNIASRGGQGASANVDVTMDTPGGVATQILIDGKPLDDNAIYHIATIDYLAKGNDYLVEFKGQPVLVRSGRPISEEFIDYIKSRGTVDSDNKARMHN